MGDIGAVNRLMAGLMESLCIGKYEKDKHTFGGLMVKEAFGAACAAALSLVLCVPLLGWALKGLVKGLLWLVALIPYVGVPFRLLREVLIWHHTPFIFLVCALVTFASWLIYGRICPAMKKNIDPLYED